MALVRVEALESGEGFMEFRYRKSWLYGLIIVFCINAILVPKIWAEDVAKVGARQPLSANDSGLYGGWTAVMAEQSSAFTFYVVQAIVPENYVTQQDATPYSHGHREGFIWNEALKAARSSGKRVIADLFLPVKKQDISLDELKRQID